jgi:hypothetical protein
MRCGLLFVLFRVGVMGWSDNNDLYSWIVTDVALPLPVQPSGGRSNHWLTGKEPSE